MPSNPVDKSMLLLYSSQDHTTVLLYHDSVTEKKRRCVSIFDTFFYFFLSDNRSLVVLSIVISVYYRTLPSLIAEFIYVCKQAWATEKSDYYTDDYSQYRTSATSQAVTDERPGDAAEDREDSGK